MNLVIVAQVNIILKLLFIIIIIHYLSSNKMYCCKQGRRELFLNTALLVTLVLINLFINYENFKIITFNKSNSGIFNNIYLKMPRKWQRQKINSLERYILEKSKETNQNAHWILYYLLHITFYMYKTLNIAYYIKYYNILH